MIAMYNAYLLGGTAERAVYNSGRLQYVGPFIKCSAFVCLSKDSIVTLHMEAAAIAASQMRFPNDFDHT